MYLTAMLLYSVLDCQMCEMDESKVIQNNTVVLSKSENEIR